MKKGFFGWWIVASCFLTFGVSTGFPYYNIAFFFDYFSKQHGWPIAMITLGAPVAVMLTIWAGPIIVPRVSPRLLIVIGTGFTFCAFQWFGRLSGATWEYFGAWCLYMIGYFLSGPIPHQILISNWFKEKRGRAMGITYVGVAVVGSAGNLLGPYLAKQMHYTEALKLMSFLVLLAWPIAIFVMKDRPQDKGQLPDGKADVSQIAQQPPAPSKGFGFLLRKPGFWLLLIGSAASIGSIAAVNFHMKFVFQAQGFEDQLARDAIWSKASFWVLWASIAGRLLAGYLADKFPRKYVMLVTYLIVAIAIPSLFLVTPEQTGFVYVFALVFGFAMGADYMLIPLMAADQFGLATLPRAMSAILPTDTISQFWFPNFVARLRDFLIGTATGPMVVSGAYYKAMLAVFGTAFLGALAIGLLPRHGSRDEPAASPEAVPARAPN
jgi:MFS family permease